MSVSFNFNFFFLSPFFFSSKKKNFKLKLTIKNNFFKLKSFIIKNKEAAGKLISVIANFINEEDRGKNILTRVLGMAHDDNNEENRIVSV